MPISGDKRDILSLQLITGMENFVKGFCFEKRISQKEIPEMFDGNALNRFARDLGLNVRVEDLIEESITVAIAKETPLEIINRITNDKNCPKVVL